MSRLLLVSLLVAAFICYSEGGVPFPRHDTNFECTTEEHRPRFHFSPKKNWMNDPNGMVYYDGLYHLYYQYHPFGMGDGPKYWGHTISRDMTSWIDMPIALSPDELGAIWSGSSVVDKDNTTGFKQGPLDLDPVVAIYTSTGARQQQSIAYSVDGGMTFTKYPGNPVLPNDELPDFRDPKVIWFDGKWVMSLAVWDRIEFFSSPDLKTWTREGEVGRNPPEGSHDGVWECPDLMPLNVTLNDGRAVEMWVLLVSVSAGAPFGGHGTFYLIGNFARINNGLEFHTVPWVRDQWIDFGPDNYAGVSFSNEPKGRKIYMGWMASPMYASVTPNVAHHGQMTVPRQLGILPVEGEGGYRLTSNPVPELANLRVPTQFVERSSFTLPAQSQVELTNGSVFTSPLMELEITVDLAEDSQFQICAHNDVSEITCFGHNEGRWELNRTRSGNTGFNDNYERVSLVHHVRETNSTTTTIRMFLDVSSLEAFADQGLTAITALHFPTRPFDKFTLFHTSSERSTPLNVRSVKVWGLQCWFPENEV